MDDERGTGVPSAVTRPATRRRHVSSGPEAVVLAVWAVFGGLFMAMFFHTGADLVNGTSAVVVYGGLVLLAILFVFVRSRTRTVRPRHFTLIEGLSALWLGVGGGITYQILSPVGSETGGVPLTTAILASIVLALPLLGCSLWLAVRGR